MTLSFGGGAGVLTIPGLTSDGETPGGVVIAGAVAAGDQAASVVPSRHNLYGSVVVRETEANQVDSDTPLIVLQDAPLPADSAIAAMAIIRNGALSGHEYLVPALTVLDTSTSTAPLASFGTGGGTMASIGRLGGIGAFGADPPTAPRTLAQATITAITDANAKTAVQAIANALADMGVLTLT